MQNHGLVCKINKGLREAESQRAKAGSETPNKNERLHGEAPDFLPQSLLDTHHRSNQEETTKKMCAAGLHKAGNYFGK